MEALVVVLHAADDILEICLGLDLLEVLQNLLYDEEYGILIRHQMPKLINLRIVVKKLRIERHPLIRKLIIRPILLNYPIHNQQHHRLLIIPIT